MSRDLDIVFLVLILIVFIKVNPFRNSLFIFPSFSWDNIGGRGLGPHFNVVQTPLFCGRFL